MCQFEARTRVRQPLHLDHVGTVEVLGHVSSSPMTQFLQPLLLEADRNQGTHAEDPMLITQALTGGIENVLFHCFLACL